MTTNRMGLEQTLSDERLELFIRQPLDNGLTRGEQMELAREALARRKASSEPVADVVAWNKPGEERKCDIRWRRFDVSPGPLFEAPPLHAVTVPDEWTDAQCLEFLTVAFRHNRIKGDIEFDDIRLGVKMANDYRPPKSVTNEP